MKAFKRILSMALVLCLMLSLCVFPTYADTEDEETVKCVFIGDSCTNGYGFRDYYGEKGISQNYYGFNIVSKSIYPYLLQQYYNQNTDMNYEIKQYSVSGNRCDEIFALLDPDEYLNNSYFEGGDGYFRNIMCNEFQYRCLCPFDEMKELYQSAVKDADVVTLEIGTNNIGCTMLGRIQGIISGDGTSYDDVINDKMQADIKKDLLIMKDITELDVLFCIADIVESLASVVDSESLNKVSNILVGIKDCLMYGYAGLCLNFNHMIDAIYKLNPDVEIVLLGLPNVIGDIKLGAGIGLNIDFGGIWGLFVEKAESYMRAVTALDPQISFVDYPDASIFFDEFKADKGARLDGISLDLLCQVVYALCDYDHSINEEFIAKAFLELEDGNTASVEGISDEELQAQYELCCMIIKAFCEAGQLKECNLVALLQNTESASALFDGDFMALFEGIDMSEELPDWLLAAVYIYAKFMLGEGVTGHPNAEGHQQVAEAIEDSCACFGDHKWLAPEWTWEETDDGYEVTADFTCYKNLLAHHKTVTVQAELDGSTVPATCFSAGEDVYRADIIIGGNTYSDLKVVKTDKADHSYVDGACEFCGLKACTAGEDHAWSDYVCDYKDGAYCHYRSCTACGAVEQTGICEPGCWLDGNGVHYSYCKVCANRIVEACSYGPANSNNNGTHTQVCTKCGDILVSACTYEPVGEAEDGKVTVKCFCGDTKVVDEDSLKPSVSNFFANLFNSIFNIGTDNTGNNRHLNSLLSLFFGSDTAKHMQNSIVFNPFKWLVK